MRLFQVLSRFQKVLPNGHIHRGKNRVVKAVTGQDIQKLKNEMEVEEQNMFYLRHAYLTSAQSSGHAKSLGKNEANFIKTKTKAKPFFEHVTVESRLAHLRVQEPWD